jgi:hypothetical protein
LPATKSAGWLLATRSNDEFYVFCINVQRRRNGLSPFLSSTQRSRRQLSWTLCYHHVFHVALCLGRNDSNDVKATGEFVYHTTNFVSVMSRQVLGVNIKRFISALLCIVAEDVSVDSGHHAISSVRRYYSLMSLS